MKQYNAIVTVIFMATSLCLLAIMIVQLFPLIREVVADVSDESSAVSYIQEFGIIGVPILTALSALQHILIIIPAPAVGVLIGLCYGILWGSIIFLAGRSIGNLFVFISVRRLRGHFSSYFKSKQNNKPKSKKFLSSDQLQKMKRPELFVFFCYLIPGMPASATTYLFAATKVSLTKYMLASILGSIPSALVYTILGSHISRGNFTTSIIIAAALAVAVLIIFLFRKKITSKIIEQGSA